MKKTIATIFFVTLFFASFSQIEIKGGYNLNFTSFNTTVGIKQNLQKNSFEYGLKVIIPTRLTYDNENLYFKHRFFPKNVKERLGFNFTYFYNINLPNSNMNPFLYYNFQYTFSSTRSEMYYKDGDPVELPYDTIQPYKLVVEKYGPFHVFENNFGIGMSTQIYKKVYLYYKLGAGAAYIIGDDPNIRDKKRLKFSSMFSASLSYKF